MKHPIQPTETDEHVVVRFKENKIVTYLLDKGPTDMNIIAGLEFSNEDRQQFAQLIGYSLSGYSDLGYVNEDAYHIAETMDETGLSEDKARIKYLEEELTAIRRGIREPIARLYGIHPDDLQEHVED